MLKPESKQAVDTFLASAKEEFAAFANQINSDTYEEAAAIILESQKNGGRLHITGIGKRCVKLDAAQQRLYQVTGIDRHGLGFLLGLQAAACC